jgi:hypothetical protein
MSFADELRTSPAAPAYRLDEKRLDACVEGIKEACMKNRTAGRVAGYLDEHNYDGSMVWRIVPEPKMRSKKEVTHWNVGSRELYTIGKNYGMNQAGNPVFKAALQQKLEALGFSALTLKLVKLEQIKETISNGFFGYDVKYEKTGEVFYALHVDIRW